MGSFVESPCIYGDKWCLTPCMKSSFAVAGPIRRCGMTRTFLKFISTPFYSQLPVLRSGAKPGAMEITDVRLSYPPQAGSTLPERTYFWATAGATAHISSKPEIGG
ncbi:hypothetical protein CISG_00928 [Coccidioides immitis RMSCC 3703]|uniref:Uncharacterized protein n=1 Tax=Coccidioides immitis RMSCC 3703 TaxID=454286 RepID=A0A0J8QQU2_COCIT|nr:hypothetical protein CISG_00928 [Coccidioides immitis RMSCC 3703]